MVARSSVSWLALFGSLCLSALVAWQAVERLTRPWPGPGIEAALPAESNSAALPVDAGPVPRASPGLEELLRRPLFRPDRRPPAPPPAAPAPVPAALPPPSPPLFLGVVIDGSVRLALVKLLGDEEAGYYAQGEKVGSWRILAIEPRSLLVEAAGGRVRLPLFSAEQAGPAVPGERASPPGGTGLIVGPANR